MLNIVYLTYQKNYSFFSDIFFQKWISQIGIEINIKNIIIVDNTETKRKTETHTWQNSIVTIYAGDNTAREFSGYQIGLSKIREEEGITLLLNDTFLLQKHYPQELLLPAVIFRCKNIENNLVIGEINHGPIGAKYDGTPAKWISTYCVIFSCRHLNSVKTAVHSAINAFTDKDVKFNKKFIDHIEKQISGLPVSKNPEEKLRKLQATEAEMIFSRALKSFGLSICSIYSASVSPWIFANYTIKRIKRKIKFLIKN